MVDEGILPVGAHHRRVVADQAGVDLHDPGTRGDRGDGPGSEAGGGWGGFDRRRRRGQQQASEPLLVP